MTRDADRGQIQAEIDALTRRLVDLEEELARLDRDPVPRVYEVDEREDETLTRRFASIPPPAPSNATVAEAPRALRSEPHLPRPARSVGYADDFAGRYVQGELLGEGGMGEVRIYTDRRIGRAVAMKVMRPQAAAIPKLRDRFLFEARVQGQLEHPNIVPIHEVGVRPDGLAYFTMKRLVGSTLYSVLRDLREGDPVARAQFTPHRLLTAFLAVCNAVEFAHQHGVVHRDLKPSNIMLGRLGEVSVLDWGVAKRVRADELPTPQTLAIEDPYTETAVGEVLGTPGYMSPEQAVGDGVITPQSDIFALGAILYEILANERFIPGDSDTEVRLATIVGSYETRLSARHPELDVAPELEWLVTQATARQPADRIGTVAEIAATLESYLEGEGDRHRRISLSNRHTQAAINALAASKADVSADEARSARKRAIEEVTRALALNGSNRGALQAMIALATDVPDVVTPEAEAVVRALESDVLRKTAKRAAAAYLIVVSNLAVLALFGVQNALALGGSVAFLLAAAGLAVYASRMPKVDERIGLPIIGLSSCGFALVSTLFGPFVFAPALVSANVIAAAIGLGARLRRIVMGLGVLAVLVPVLAPYLGLWEAQWVFQEGLIVIRPSAVRFDETLSVIFLMAVSVGVVVLPTLVVGVERDARARTERRFALQAQQLADFLPAEARGKVAASVREKRS
jgi:serine/threonine protein kinase